MEFMRFSNKDALSTYFIYGYGGHGQVIRDAILSSGRPWTIRYVDDNEELEGEPDVICPADVPEQARIVLGVGDNQARSSVFGRLQNSGKSLIFPEVRHQCSYIAPSALQCEGSVICAGAVVNPGTFVREFSIVNTAASVDHDCTVGAFSHIAPGVHLCGSVTVGSRVLIGVGSCVVPDIVIGSDSIIGAGSVVINDIPPGVLAYGNPCKVIKEIG